MNLIDLGALGFGRPEMLHDLPAGGRRLVQRPQGYRATIVAGQVVMDDGEPTGRAAGRPRAGCPNGVRAVVAVESRRLTRPELTHLQMSESVRGCPSLR